MRPDRQAGAADSHADGTWAVTEFGTAALGDTRRTARLVDLAGTLAKRPAASLPESCRDSAQLKAAYRFVENEAITPEAMLAPHQQATRERCAMVPLVLAVQDTTELDYSQHPQTTGLGPLSHPAHQGFHLHTTLAITPDHLPLGVLALEEWTRASAAEPVRATRRTRAVDTKESAKWLHSLEAVRAARLACLTTTFVSVGDREADVYDLLVAPRPAGVELLVRAAQDRCVTDPEARRLWAALAQATIVTTATVRVPRRAAPAGRAVQPARTAEVVVHARAVTVRPPQYRIRQDRALPPVALWAVWAIEVAPPVGATPVEWLLLTTVPTTTAAQAVERLAWYGCRWGIEVWHKVLKSGCRIEARQLEDAAHLRRALALYAVIAWRILYATLLARAAPDLPATALLAPDEWQALWCAIHRQPLPPTTPPTLRQAVRWIARLGGFLDRPAAGEPGVTTLWKGLQHLADLTTMYAIIKPATPPPLVGND
jgi:hypothetical protein